VKGGAEREREETERLCAVLTVLALSGYCFYTNWLFPCVCTSIGGCYSYIIPFIDCKWHCGALRSMHSGSQSLANWKVRKCTRDDTASISSQLDVDL